MIRHILTKRDKYSAGTHRKQCRQATLIQIKAVPIQIVLFQCVIRP